MSFIRRLSDVQPVFRRRASSVSLIVPLNGEEEDGDVLSPLPISRKLYMSPKWSSLTSLEVGLRERVDMSWVGEWAIYINLAIFRYG